MKRIICLIIALCLVLSSYSLCFATATNWDTADQANLRYIMQSLTSSTGTVVSILNTISTRTNNIYNKCVDIYNALFDNGNNITYWVHAISTWMSPIYNSITNIPVDLSTIIGSLGFYDSNSTYHPYLNEINTKFGSYGPYTVWKLNGDNTVTYESWAARDFPSWMIDLLRRSQETYVTGFYNLTTRTAYGDATRYTTSWSDLSSSAISHRSWADSQLDILTKIQTPVARLAYVLASNERIEAQEAAAANEEAVVDNFIDSSGAGSASTSDIGSISDLSSGYKNNFGSDAQVTGIFNIFNSNNMGWFSQETANQLDTTTPTRRGSSFDTPLLDQQINDIYDQIGVKHD